MKALILAAGYATRLRPLTDSLPKQLLPVGGKPIVDWILDRIREAGIDDVHLVTNGRFAKDFEPWAAAAGVHVHDDGTTTNETRLGAIGDIRFVQEHAALDDDLLVIAGDNLFDYSLSDYIAFWAGKDGASAVAVYDVGDRELAKQYGVVELGEDDRIVDFVEKPEDPPSTLAATATYIYARATRRARLDVPRRRQSAGSARVLHRLAPSPRTGLRVPDPGRLVRHRGRGPAARGRQPAAGGGGAPHSEGVFAGLECRPWPAPSFVPRTFAGT